MSNMPRQSDVLGEYAPDRFMITLSPDHPIVDPTTFKLLPLNDDTISVVFHEYSHYLQNIATVAGYHSFRRSISLWRLFTETVGPEGTSKGSDSLTPERSEWVAQYLAIAGRFDGDDEVNLPKTLKIQSFRITGITRTPFEPRLGTGTVLLTQVILRGEVSGRTNAKMPFEYHFGTIAIMEGLAHELDQIVAFGVDGRRTLKYVAPPFPYHALRELVAYVLPGADPISILRLGCLSLMSNDPAGALMDLCELTAARISYGMPLAVAIDNVVETCSERIEALTDAVLAHDIPE